MKTNTKKTLQFYWEEARRHKVQFFVITAAITAAAAVAATIPLFYKKFFDAPTQGPGNAAILVKILVSIGALEILRWSLRRTAAFTNTPFQTTIIADLSTRCFKYLHKHSFTYFNNNFVGSLVKRVNWFTRAFEGTADKIFWTILPLIINTSLIIVILFRRNTTLGFAVVVWTTLFLLVNWLFTSYKIKFELERNESESKATATLADTITNNSNVKLFVGFDREVENYEEKNNKVRKLRVFTWTLDNIFDALQGLLVVGLQIGVFYLAIQLYEKRLITIGDFVLIQTYLIIIFESVWSFGQVIRQLYSDLADAEEMTVIMMTPHEIQDTTNATELSVTHGQIEFNDVDFNYNDTRKIITGMNFTIKPEEKVALVGPSGAGKSTIIKLLLRMHEVTSGNIMIDGQKINSVTQESLWRAISLVPQDPILFHRTLIENIRYGRPDATDLEVIEAAKLAHCHEFISSFPEGYGTFVGERGVKLSGGERQRVAIARAILRNAPILVLDEATSSLDSESESLIQDALNTLMKNKTVIVIAHRLSTIMKMDRIIVIKDGAVAEEGTHAQLLENKNGLYHDLWKLQAGGFMPDLPATTATEEAAHEEPTQTIDQVEILAEES